MWFMDCQYTSKDHVELLICQHSLVLHLRDSLNPFSVQPVFVFWIASNQVQNLAHGLVELHQVHTSPALGAAEHCECHIVCYQ